MSRPGSAPRVAGREPRTASARVEALLARMTTAEKIGQMTLLTVEAVSAQRGTAHQSHVLDPERLGRALVTCHVGALINVWDVALTPDQWRERLLMIQEVATERTRLGIPVLYGIDAVHGANYTRGATLFPHGLGLAATWDPDLVRRTAAVTAAELRACGIPWNLHPGLDLGRQPLWSRFFETFGEDVHLARTLGRAMVDGYQGAGRPDAAVAACAKHYVGYGFPLSGRDRTPAWIPEHFLREYFLPPFAGAVKAGVASVMVNSGEVNGTPVHASRYLLTDVLRRELGFEGVIVTDWEDIIKLHTVHRVAASEREAVRLAVEAGVDLSMTPFTLSFQDHLAALVDEGVIPMARLDASVRRILALKEALGLFEAPVPPPPPGVRVGGGEATARKAATASLVLAENREALPLPADARVLLCGPGADARAPLAGPWSYTWQGTDEAAYPPDFRTLREAFAARNARMTCIPGATYDAAHDVAAAVAAARDADVVVLCLAERPAVEKPGDLDDLALPPAQTALAEALLDTGTPVVLVLMVGRPRLVRALVDRAEAVVLAFYPGLYGADALADVLYGTASPGGYLPFSYPRYPAALIPYDHRPSERLERDYGVARDFGMDAYQPQWPFAHGLGYTTFAFHHLHVAPTRVAPGDTVRVSVSVENTGARDGEALVPVFVGDRYASLTPPVERLRAFRKVALAPGESRRLHFDLDTDALAFVAPDLRRVLEPGAFDVRVGNLRASFEVAGLSGGGRWRMTVIPNRSPFPIDGGPSLPSARQDDSDVERIPVLHRRGAFLAFGTSG